MFFKIYLPYQRNLKCNFLLTVQLVKFIFNKIILINVFHLLNILNNKTCGYFKYSAVLNLINNI